VDLCRADCNDLKKCRRWRQEEGEICLQVGRSNSRRRQMAKSEHEYRGFVVAASQGSFLYSILLLNN